MGMASSQARLLTLTSRLHSIEHKAQKIEAEKLRLANDSSRVYDTYLDKLEATKIQYSALSSNGTIDYVDATLAKLENGAVPSYAGETSKNTYLLYNGAENKILVTPEFAAEYGITGENAESIGSLDNYLTAHGCTKEPVMQTVTEINYNDIQSVTPLGNKVLSAPGERVVNDDNTYNISGTLSAPVDNSVGASTSYTVSGTTPSVSSTNFIENTVTKPAVNGGTPATSIVETPVVTSSNTIYTRTISNTESIQTFNKFELDFGENLNTQFSTLYPDIDWSTGEHAIYTYYEDRINTFGDKGYFGGPHFNYNQTTTWNEVLTAIADNSEGHATYNGSGKLVSDIPIYILNGLHTSEKFYDDFDSKENITWNAPQNITRNTLLKDLVYCKENYTNFFNMFGSSGVTIGSNSVTTYNGSVDIENLTLGEYLDNVKSQYPEFSWTIDSSGNIVMTSNNASIGFKYGTQTSETTENNETTITLNADAIAENIYLAESIGSESFLDSYNTSHDSTVNGYKSQIQSVSNKKALAILAKNLETALNSNNKADIATASNNLKSFLNSGSTSVDTSIYNDSTVTSSRSSATTITNTTFRFVIDTTSNSTVTPSTFDKPTGESNITKGSLTVASNSDMIANLAYKLYQNNNAQTYEQYLASIQGQGYNAYQLAQLIEEFGTFKTQLAAGSDLKGSLTKYDATHYNLNQSSSNNYNVTNNSTPATHEVTVANPDDILDILAYDVYTKKGSGDPNTIKTQLRYEFSNQELAGLSFYYGQPAWNAIVNNLSTSMNASTVASYSNKYDGYNITYKPSNDVNIQTNTNSHTETVPGELNIPNIKGIASNMAIAFRKAGYTVNEADIRTKLEAKYGTDSNNNNLTLANMNEIICNYINNNTGNVTNIYNHIMNNNALSITHTYNTNYNATRVDMGVARVTYGTTSHEEPTGEMKWVDNENYRTWYSKYMKLAALQGHTFEIVDAALCTKNEYINNWITEGGAHLLAFESTENGQFKLKDTNVSVETALIEVQNEKDLKKAEAQYEADMLKIDKKDRKYDTELAKLENERAAIKEEVETLKTVAKENVERTFKLFS